VLLCVHLLALPSLLPLLAKQTLLARALGTMGLLAPLGVLMGLPFPVALRLLAPQAATLTPWAWGVNAVGSVLGSVAAVGMAVAWGLQAVLMVSALVYVCTGWWAHALLRKIPSPGER